MFKQCFNKEKYLCINMPGKYKSAYAKFRCGVAPLRIETGRYEGIMVDNRLCFNEQCKKNNIIEDEKHVLINCPVYADLRAILFRHASSFNCDFVNLSDDDKFKFLFTDENVCYFLAKICYDVLLKRKGILYNCR